jgi:hypothetical protein
MTAARVARPRHATHPQPGRVRVAITHAIGWMLTDHDDHIPNRIQAAVWLVAFLALFTCMAVQQR